ncbi:MAG: pyrimidine-nucleoside phosphorylase [Bacillales bacterium]|jgi:pyrimidine-nucleoside phosphorylase|nr:pyrimidine-nucleoside phosphorylase [Bacillales bacterium]
MRAVDIICKKKDNNELSKEEIEFFINGFVNGSIPDYQASALAMAIVLNGMNSRETADLTSVMMHSGKILDLSSIKGLKVDKHSTGGVGDKTSLVLGPLVASLGAKVAKMSGRGLGHTGGTLDKLESIPGVSISLTQEAFIKQVNEIGIALMGQTNDLVPADKKLYALRDVTATVESLPLISSSIMSKKLATGSDAILLDVKYGEGAFMKSVEDAVNLATVMVEIGKHLKRDTRAIITDMEQPLGLAIGNILEVKEAVNTLKGNGPKDLVELCLEAGSIMLVQSKVYEDREKAKEDLLKNIENGLAFKKLKEFIKAQGGDVSYLDNLDKFETSKYVYEIKAKRDGYLKRAQALTLGTSAMKLGAGRLTKEDLIDYPSGIVIRHKIGDKISKGEVLATCYTNYENVNEVLKEVEEAFSIVSEKVNPLPVIAKYLV